MTAYYVMNIQVKDNTVSGNVINAQNITVTLLYLGKTLTETTNSTGQVVFRASLNNNFVQSVAVDIEIFDPAGQLYS